MKGGRDAGDGCDCGYPMEAADEEQLFRQAPEHVDRDHPETDLTDEQLREILAEGAYTKYDRQIAQALRRT